MFPFIDAIEKVIFLSTHLTCWCLILTFSWKHNFWVSNLELEKLLDSLYKKVGHNWIFHYWWMMSNLESYHLGWSRKNWRTNCICEERLLIVFLIIICAVLEIRSWKAFRKTFIGVSANSTKIILFSTKTFCPICTTFWSCLWQNCLL